MLPTDPQLLALNEMQLEFIEYSIICDDPKALKKLENTVTDDSFDDWVKDFEKEEINNINKEKEKQLRAEREKIDNAELEAFRQRLTNKDVPPVPAAEPIKIENEEYDTISVTNDDINDFEPIEL